MSQVEVLNSAAAAKATYKKMILDGRGPKSAQDACRAHVQACKTAFMNIPAEQRVPEVIAAHQGAIALLASQTQPEKKKARASEPPVPVRSADE